MKSYGVNLELPFKCADGASAYWVSAGFKTLSTVSYPVIQWNGEEIVFLKTSMAPLLQHRNCHYSWKSNLGKENQREKEKRQTVQIQWQTLQITFFIFRRWERSSHSPLVYLRNGCTHWSSLLPFFLSLTFLTVKNYLFNFASHFQGRKSVLMKRWYYCSSKNLQVWFERVKQCMA